MTKKANKVLVLGIDGLDPRLTQKYIDEGKMPNAKKFLEKGAAHTRLEMIGGQPTVTHQCGPPWPLVPTLLCMASPTTGTVRQNWIP